MKLSLIIGLAASALICNQASARSLGNLSEEQKPKALIQSGEILQSLTEHMNGSNSNELNTSDVRRGGHRYGGYHYGGGYHHRGYYPYYGGYYYPYSYYYPYYGGYSYPYYRNRWWRAQEGTSGLNENRTHSSQPQTVEEPSRLPVVCFASDSSGNWYADANVASNADSIQQSANNECLSSGSQCTQNLGCALISEQE